MTNINTHRTSLLADRFGLAVGARLDHGALELPYHVTERLRAARVQAVARRQVAAAAQPAPSIFGLGGAATLSFGDEGRSVWNRVASVLPLIVLAAGLVFIYSVQTDRRASELAEVDVALLTDDLPPQAYTDPGFAQFLRTGGQ